MRRDLGIPTLLERPGAEESAALCAELGLGFVELNANLPPYADVRAVDGGALRRLSRETGVYFTLHLDERFDPCDFNPAVRGAWLDTFCRALALAAEAEMPVLNLHLPFGVYFTLPEGRVYLYEREKARFLAGLEALRALAEREGAPGTLVCLENTSGFPPFAREGLEMLLKSPRFGLTLDAGHLRAAGCADAEFFAAHEDRLRHMHLHDAADGRDHLPLGAGTLDWQKALALAREKRLRAVVEVKTEAALRASVRAIQNEWEEHPRCT